MRGMSQFQKALKGSQWGVLTIKIIKNCSFKGQVYTQADHLIIKIN